MKALCLTFYLSIIPFWAAWSQTSNYYPDFLSVYFYNMALANPSYVPIEAKADFALNYKFATGPVQDVSTLAFSGAKIWGQENNSTHVGRAIVHNEQEGPYINYPRTYLNYAYRLKVGENTSLMSGLALGGAGIFFSAPSATTSIYLPDGALGVAFQHRKISLGISSLQIFNSTVSPLLATIRFARYYQGHLEAEKELGIDWKCNTYLFWRLLPQANDDATAAISLLYRESISIGTAYRKQAGLAVFTSFAINSDTNPFLISFTYNSPFFSNIPRFQNSMEIGLGYTIR